MTSITMVIIQWDARGLYIHSLTHTHTHTQLDIIANVAGETSIHSILREFRVSIA